MKRTVSEWSQIQCYLPGVIEFPIGETVHDDLWRKIENRTWGKRYQASVAIKLTRGEEEQVEFAEQKLVEFNPGYR